MKNFNTLLKNHLKNSNIKILHLSTVSSTNTYLKNMINQNTPEGLTVIADSQTDGFGRFDRKFYSPQNSGIYMSILLRPNIKGFDTTLITSAAAVAVANACEELSHKKVAIKWVNDIFIDGKKICGILAQGAVNPKSTIPEYVILGIGINVFEPLNGFNREIQNIAGSIFSDFDIDLKARLTANIINNFFEIYKNINSKEHLKTYREKSLVLGKTICVLKNNKSLPARALEIDDNCCLLVEYTDGKREILSSGEISIKI